MMPPLKALELLEKIGRGEKLTEEELRYLKRYVPVKKHKIWPGWSGNGIQRAIILIEKAKMSIEGFSTGKEDKAKKLQVKLPKPTKPKIVKPKLKVKLS